MTRGKRETSGEERELFREVFRDARLLKRKSLSAKPDRPKAPAKTADEMVAAVPQVESARRGLDGRTSERLRRGLVEPQARLDLHGMTEAAAHRALVGFIRSAYTRGLRLVVVVTGKGGKQQDEAFDLELDRRSRGVLKSLTPRWLDEPELAPYIVEARSAHRRHGGAGAMYIYLRKNTR